MEIKKKKFRILMGKVRFWNRDRRAGLWEACKWRLKKKKKKYIYLFFQSYFFSNLTRFFTHSIFKFERIIFYCTQSLTFFSQFKFWTRTRPMAPKIVADYPKDLFTLYLAITIVSIVFYLYSISSINERRPWHDILATVSAPVKCVQYFC